MFKQYFFIQLNITKELIISIFILHLNFSDLCVGNGIFYCTHLVQVIK
jgi:hypothetical protein